MKNSLILFIIFFSETLHSKNLLIQSKNISLEKDRKSQYLKMRFLLKQMKITQSRVIMLSMIKKME